jgi:hypothetical protein
MEHPNKLTPCSNADDDDELVGRILKIICGAVSECRNQ